MQASIRQAAVLSCAAWHATCAAPAQPAVSCQSPDRACHNLYHLPLQPAGEEKAADEETGDEEAAAQPEGEGGSEEEKKGAPAPASEDGVMKVGGLPPCAPACALRAAYCMLVVWVQLHCLHTCTF